MAGQIPTRGPLGQRTAPAKKAPSKALAVVKDKSPDKLDTDLTTAKAKALTSKIQAGLQNTIDLCQQAWAGRVWLALGYKTWDEYVKTEFDTAPLSLPREKRKEAVRSLRERGWSTPAISVVTGTSQSQADRDARDAQATQNGYGADTEPPLDVETDDDPEAGTEPEKTVTGVDGKSYPAAKPPTTPKAPNVVAAARKIAKDVEKITVCLGKLLDCDDYEANRTDVVEALQQAIKDFADEANNLQPDDALISA